jgi:large subunit ribosomal protein L17
MRHRIETARLNRNKAHLGAMLRNLATSIILYEKVKTTRSKARVVQPIIEKLIVDAKQQSSSLAMRKLNAYFSDPNASKKLVSELSKRYKDRKSGFVRVIPLGYRPGDAAPVVQIELV